MNFSRQRILLFIAISVMMWLLFDLWSAPYISVVFFFCLAMNMFFESNEDRVAHAKANAEIAIAKQIERLAESNIHPQVHAEVSKEEELLRLRTKETEELVKLRQAVADLEKKIGTKEH